MEPVLTSSASIHFGRFQVLPHRRELLADGEPLRLGGRAYDILMALMEARGAVVSGEALIAQVWPGRVVTENALQVQISALRAVFGADRELIRTVSGRGYQFTGEFSLGTTSRDAHADVSKEMWRTPATPVPTNLLAPTSRLIGRHDELAEILALTASNRLVTLVGPGGIGKTRLALAVARERLPDFADGVWLAEFSPLSDPRLVPATVAASVRLELAPGEVLARRVAQALGSRRLLLVLDTCEHVVNAAAELAEAILWTAPAIAIIATSREPLRVDGEQIYLVAPLAVPTMEGEERHLYGAAELFAVRSREAGAKVPDDSRIALVIADICRHLDGIPLAIELAAARAATLGVTELAAHLDDRFNLLTSGRRAAQQRHQTLRATLDWSFDLLSEAERVILRRLATFAGAFNLEAASAVASGTGISRLNVVDGLASLAAKSLVTTEIDGTDMRYRLLDTTRAYAIEKLIESGEADAIRRCHAEYFRDMFQAVPEDRKAINDWPASVPPEIDNLRAALTWAFGAEGDTAIGIALAAASVPVWFEMSWLAECRGWMEKALDGVDAGSDPTREMVLECALGYALMFAQGMNDRARTALTRATELAERLGDLDYQLRTLAGLASICHRLQDFHSAVALGRRAEQAVKTSVDPAVLATSDWILGSSLQLVGEYAEALTYAQRTYMRTSIPAVRRAHITRLGRDSLISAGATVAIVLWALGRPDQSAQTARNVLADAEAGDHPVSLCLALTWCGCIVPLRVGDLPTAARAAARLKDYAQSHGLSAYYANGQCFEGQLAAKRGDQAAAEQLLRAGLANLHQTQSETFYTVFLTALAEVLMSTERRDEGLAAADEALRRTERSNALWWMPEALRVKGELLLLSEDRASAAEGLFRRSLDLARRQGALSWELRTLTSLARSRRKQGRTVEAHDFLASVYWRFTEGFETPDLLSAKMLLEALKA